MKIARAVWAATAACIATATAACGEGTPSAGEITARRINIVDESGEIRLVIAAELPDTMWRGERHERSIAPAGIVWYDRNGDESGGLAVSNVPGWKGGAPEGSVRMVTFDFTHQITDAVRLDTYESADGSAWSGGLTVFDRRHVETGPVTSSQGTERVQLGTRNGDAALVIRDADEKPRIRIGVDRGGIAAIEILDDRGTIVHRLPEK